MNGKFNSAKIFRQPFYEDNMRLEQRKFLITLCENLLEKNECLI